MTSGTFWRLSSWRSSFQLLPPSAWRASTGCRQSLPSFTFTCFFLLQTFAFSIKIQGYIFPNFHTFLLNFDILPAIGADRPPWWRICPCFSSWDEGQDFHTAWKHFLSQLWGEGIALREKKSCENTLLMVGVEKPVSTGSLLLMPRPQNCLNLLTRKNF